MQEVVAIEVAIIELEQQVRNSLICGLKLKKVREHLALARSSSWPLETRERALARVRQQLKGGSDHG